MIDLRSAVALLVIWGKVNTTTALAGQGPGQNPKLWLPQPAYRCYRLRALLVHGCALETVLVEPLLSARPVSVYGCSDPTVTAGGKRAQTNEQDCMRQRR